MDKVWEVATMLAHRDMRDFHPANTLPAVTAAAAGTAAARFNVNGTLLTSLHC